MFCGNCGKQLADGARFCPNCGKPQNVQPAQQPQQSSYAPVQQPVAPVQPQQNTYAPVYQQPVAPAPVEQPVAPAPVEQLVAPAPVEQPVAPAPVEQPMAPAPVEQPVAPAPVEQPVAPAPVEQPVAPAPVQRPVAPVQSQQNTYVPASQQPKAAAQPVEEPPVYPAPDAFVLPRQEPVKETPSFAVNAPVEEKPKKKKGKGGKIALIVIALLLVGAIVLAAFNWGSIVRFFKRNMMEPTDYAKDVEKNAAAAVAKDIGTAYDAALANASMSDMSSQSQITLSISDEVMVGIEEVLSQEGMDMDLGWLDDISLDMDASMKDGKMGADIGVALNGAHVLTLSAVWDLETQILWMGIPELNDVYLEMDMEEVMGEDLSDLYPTMMQMQAMSEELIKAMPTGAELESMINTYIGIILDHVQDVEKSTETFKLNGLKQDLLVLTADFSQKDIMDIYIAVMEQVRDDEQVKDLLVGFAGIMGEDAEYIEEIYADSVDEVLAEMEDAREEATNKNALTLETILDNQDNIVGRTITLDLGGERGTISYVTVTEGEKFAFKADMESVLTVTGEGTIKDGKTNGEYVLEVMGEEYLTLQVKNYSTADNGGFAGTFVLSPESALLEAMEMDSDMLKLIGSNVSIELSLDTTTETPAMSFGILAAGVDLISIDVSSKTGKAGSVSAPAKSFDVNDDDAGYAWLADLDLDAVVKNLEKTGIPEEYMDMINQVAELFAAEFQ